MSILWNHVVFKFDKGKSNLDKIILQSKTIRQLDPHINKLYKAEWHHCCRCISHKSASRSIAPWYCLGASRKASLKHRIASSPRLDLFTEVMQVASEQSLNQKSSNKTPAYQCSGLWFPLGVVGTLEGLSIPTKLKRRTNVGLKVRHGILNAFQKMFECLLTLRNVNLHETCGKSWNLCVAAAKAHHTSSHRSKCLGQSPSASLLQAGAKWGGATRHLRLGSQCTAALYENPWSVAYITYIGVPHTFEPTHTYQNGLPGFF